MAYKISKTYHRPAILGHPWPNGSYNTETSGWILHPDMDANRFAEIESRHPKKTRNSVLSNDKLTLTIEVVWETEQDWNAWQADQDVQAHFKWVSDYCAMYEITVEDRVTEQLD
jgi:hypothetical protein